MAEHREDRRIQKTRKALQEALTSLMQEHKYETIPIKAILNRANVGRSTFYMHYEDKDSLLRAGLDGLGKWLRQEQGVALPAGKGYRSIAFSLALFQHAYGNKTLFEKLVGSKGWEIVRRHLEEILVGLIRKEAKSCFRNKGLSPASFDLYVFHLASSFMSVMTWWLSQKIPLSPEVINSLFLELVLPTVREHENQA